MYKLPSTDLLNEVTKVLDSTTEKLNKNAEIIKDTLNNFKILVSVEGTTRNSRITRYEIKLAQGVRIKKITDLTDEIALSLGVRNIRIEPIPEKQTIGIEVPNTKAESINLGKIIQSDVFQNRKCTLPFVIGEDINGNPVIGDIAAMPHLLIAGTTGSGKSVFINTIINSLLYKLSPDELKFILIDPKKVELSIYNDIPHLICPIITEPSKAMKILNWVVDEMERRYDLLLSKGVKNIEKYNVVSTEKIPSIVIIIDEFADLMMASQEKFENVVCRIAQKARAAGIHLIIGTQRPSVDIITGIIKANIPSRIAFTTSSYVDSRVILDAKGAENLLGKGDMLYSPVDESNPIRIQGTYISDEEIENVVNFIKSNNDKVVYDEKIVESLNGTMKKEKKYFNPNGTYNIHGKIIPGKVWEDRITRVEDGFKTVYYYQVGDKLVNLLDMF